MAVMAASQSVNCYSRGYLFDIFHFGYASLANVLVTGDRHFADAAAFAHEVSHPTVWNIRETELTRRQYPIQYPLTPPLL